MRTVQTDFFIAVTFMEVLEHGGAFLFVKIWGIGVGEVLVTHIFNGFLANVPLRRTCRIGASS